MAKTIFIVYLRTDVARVVFSHAVANPPTPLLGPVPWHIFLYPHTTPPSSTQRVALVYLVRCVSSCQLKPLPFVPEAPARFELHRHCCPLSLHFMSQSGIFDCKTLAVVISSLLKNRM